jgi:formylmethanofuran dehydrogenase subunit C
MNDVGHASSNADRVVTLTLRAVIDAPLDVDGITPDRLATLSAHEIAALPVWAGGRAAAVGDFFSIGGERSATVRVVGDLSRVNGLGAGMAAGELIVDGSAGRRVGAAMRGGVLTVNGDVGDDAGVALAGGLLRVNGNAGDRLGAAEAGASKGMTGGEIIVTGSAGERVAARARRGLVVVAGDVGAHAAHAIIAGTLVVVGRVGAAAGRGSKRGTIVTTRPMEVPPTYTYACTFEPPHVRLTMTYLRRRHALAIDDRAIGGRYRRYCGDAGDPGKGEILVWTGP